jgi:GNAT superfamily N-acetyltransferase
MDFKVRIQKTLVEKKNRLIVVAIEKNEIVGSCIVDYFSATPLLYNLYVDEDARLFGVATGIINKVIEYCKIGDKISLCLNVSGDNSAKEMYKKIGFKTIYDYPDDDEVMMCILMKKETNG